MATPTSSRVTQLGSTLDRVYEPKKPGPCRRLLKCCKALLIALAVCGCVALFYGWWQHEQLLAQRGTVAKEWSEKFEEQSAALKKMQRQVVRVVERTSAANSSVKLLIREAKQQQKEIGREIRRHHSKLDAMLAKLKIVNGTLAVRGRAKGPVIQEMTARAKAAAAGVGGGSAKEATPKKEEDDEEDDQEEEDDEKEESLANKTSAKNGRKKKSKKGKRKRKGGRG